MTQLAQWKRSTAILFSVGLLAGCSSGASPAPSTGAATATPAAATETPVESPSEAAGLPGCSDAGDITLTVGFSEAGEVIQAEFKKLAAVFESQNPNVKVQINAKDWASAWDTIKLAMAGDNPPDVMQANHGWTINGALMKAGLILNLDKYAAAYGWEQAFPASALKVQRFTTDGKTFGEGSIWSMTQAIQYVGVFYNKEKLAALGVTDVATLDTKAALLTLLDKAKAAGELPVMLGDSDQWPALHNLSLFNGWYVSTEAINNWVFNVAGSTYNDAGHIQAGNDFRAWMQNGYYNKDALATSFNDAVARFGTGEGVFYIGGTWALGDIYKAMGDNAGFMLFPVGDSGKHAAVGGYSLPFVVSAKTKYPDCAASFVNFVTQSPEAIAAQIAAGGPSSALAGANATIDNPLLKQMADEYARLNADNGLFTWEDWPTSTMGTLMKAQSQLLLGGQITSEAYAKAIQDDWDAYMASQP
ncbi:MAG: ABC transporter substrate-binding protein [Candidatus Limnocylindrales bacterium]